MAVFHNLLFCLVEGGLAAVFCFAALLGQGLHVGDVLNREESIYKAEPRRALMESEYESKLIDLIQVRLIKVWLVDGPVTAEDLKRSRKIATELAKSRKEMITS